MKKVEILDKMGVRRRVRALEKRGDFLDLLKDAWLKHSYMKCDGVIAINLITGEFFTYAKYPSVENHTMDNNYIDVVIIERELKHNWSDILADKQVSGSFYLEIERRYE